MKHFRLRIKDESISKATFGDLLSLQRVFQEADIFISKENYQFMEQISLHHGSKVTKLLIRSEEFDVGGSFLNILKNFPLLTELQFTNFYLQKYFYKAPRTLLPNLKILKFDSSCHDLLVGLDAPQLEYLELFDTDSNFYCLNSFLETCPNLETLVFRDDISYLPIFREPKKLPLNLKVFEVSNRAEASMQGLEDFLEKFSSLEVLKISCGMDSDIMFPEPPNIPFRLTKLDQEIWSPYVGEIINDNYCAFLETQKETLKEIRSIYLFPSSVEIDSEYLVLFTRMKSLEKLTFDVKNPFPKSDEFYQNLQPILTVKELRFTNIEKKTIEFEIKLTKFLRNMLPLFPNLELFECVYPVDDIPYLATFLAQNNPKLKTVSLWSP
jgi:hypothetical protein